MPPALNNNWFCRKRSLTPNPAVLPTIKARNHGDIMYFHWNVECEWNSDYFLGNNAYIMPILHSHQSSDVRFSGSFSIFQESNQCLRTDIIPDITHISRIFSSSRNPGVFVTFISSLSMNEYETSAQPIRVNIWEASDKSLFLRRFKHQFRFWLANRCKSWLIRAHKTYGTLTQPPMPTSGFIGKIDVPKSGWCFFLNAFELRNVCTALNSIVNAFVNSVRKAVLLLVRKVCWLLVDQFAFFFVNDGFGRGIF
jgi:hypothetical protein